MSQYYSSPRWSAEVADCSMPMTFDQYSKCSYKCLYCFAAYQKGIGHSKESYLAGQVRPVNVQAVKRLFTDPGHSSFAGMIRERKVLQWGGLADPFDEHERRLGTGLELLRFFREIEYPICFSTKGTWWTEDARYLELFTGATFWNTKLSIISLDAEKARRIEIGVDDPMTRLKAIERVARCGAGGATLRLRPFIMGMSNPTHTELIRLAGEHGATAVSTEFFCLERRSPVLKTFMPVFDKVCGFDVVGYYKMNSMGSGYLRLNRNLKRRYVDQMEQACRDAGMRFYVSDAHFKERCDNGSCCGLPEDWNYSRGQFCEALLLCKRNGIVTWPEVGQHLDYAKTFLWRSEGHASNSEHCSRFHTATMYDYLRHLWNHPNNGQSPYKMFEGIMKPTHLDDNGDLVYAYDPTRA